MAKTQGFDNFAGNSSVMETAINLPVQFTESAQSEIHRLIETGACGADQYLRVGVKGGGCSGMTYVLDFDQRKENDDVYELNGFQFILDRSHSIYLLGMEIDWSGGLNARGFTFRNPNASSTCGCGTSFAV
jgi:iron-sulfur cluster assembly protein